MLPARHHDRHPTGALAVESLRPGDQVTVIERGMHVARPVALERSENDECRLLRPSRPGVTELDLPEAVAETLLGVLVSGTLPYCQERAA